MIYIKSKENNLFLLLKKIREKKYREKYNLFLSEGLKTGYLNNDLSVIKSGPVPENIIICESKKSEYEEIINTFSTKIYILSDSLFKEVSTQENSQGIIMVYSFFAEKELSTFGNDIIILDKIQEPGNLGTIIRTADSAGFTDIILVKGCVDIYNEKVVRASMGSIFNVNFITLEENIIVEYLKKEKYKIFVTNLSDDSISYDKIELSDKNCFIFGNEGKGVSDILIANGDCNVKIPIYGKAESLNVGVATGIVLYKIQEIKEKSLK